MTIIDDAQHADRYTFNRRHNINSYKEKRAEYKSMRINTNICLFENSLVLAIYQALLTSRLITDRRTRNCGFLKVPYWVLYSSWSTSTISLLPGSGRNWRIALLKATQGCRVSGDAPVRSRNTDFTTGSGSHWLLTITINTRRANHLPPPPTFAHTRTPTPGKYKQSDLVSLFWILNFIEWWSELKFLAEPDHYSKVWGIKHYLTS